MTPYLLNMSDEPQLAGCLMYLLQKGERTSIGSDPDNTIVVDGLGVLPKLGDQTKDLRGANLPSDQSHGYIPGMAGWWFILWLLVWWPVVAENSFITTNVQQGDRYNKTWYLLGWWFDDTASVGLPHNYHQADRPQRWIMKWGTSAASWMWTTSSSPWADQTLPKHMCWSMARPWQGIAWFSHIMIAFVPWRPRIGDGGTALNSANRLMILLICCSWQLFFWLTKIVSALKGSFCWLLCQDSSRGLLRNIPNISVSQLRVLSRKMPETAHQQELSFFYKSVFSCSTMHPITEKAFLFHFKKMRFPDCIQCCKTGCFRKHSCRKDWTVDQFMLSLRYAQEHLTGQREIHINQPATFGINHQAWWNGHCI